MPNIKPIRTAEWSVSADLSAVTPSAPVPAGVQGEDNATLAIFHLGTDSPLVDPLYQLYIECINTAGEYDKTQPLTVTPEGDVKVPIPLAWTQFGGENTVRLVATQNGQIVYTLEGRMSFVSRSTASRKVDSLLRTYIQQTLDATQENADLATQAAENARKSAGEARSDAKTAVQNAQMAVQAAAGLETAVNQASAAAASAMQAAQEADKHVSAAAGAADRSKQSAKQAGIAAEQAISSERTASASAQQATASAAAASASEKAVSSAAQTVSELTAEAGASATAAGESAASAQKSAAAAQTAASSAAQSISEHNQDRTAHSHLFSIKVDKADADNTFANAVCCQAAGTVIAADNVSPVEHTVWSRLYRQNLFDSTVARMQHVLKTGDGTFRADLNNFPYAGVTVSASGCDFQAGSKVFFRFQCETRQFGTPALVFWGTFSDGKNYYQKSGTPNARTVTATLPPTTVKIQSVEMRFQEAYPGITDTVSLYSHIQLSVGEAVPYAPYVPDLSKVKLSCLGSNFFDTSQVGKTESAEAKDPGTIVLSTVSSNQLIPISKTLGELCPCLIPGKKYVFSAETPADNKSVYIYDTETSWPFGSSLVLTREMINSKIGFYGIAKPNPDGTFPKTVIRRIRISREKEMPFEPYKCSRYVPLPDGTIPDMRSVSPCMTIVTDTPGTLIRVVYHPDINRVLENLQEQINGLRAAADGRA